MVEAEKIIDEASHQPEYYEELKIPTIAPAYYYAPGVKKDDYSYKIVLSKKNDCSDYFYDRIKKIFDTYAGKTANLICVAPSSEVGKYSPTLLRLAERLSEYSGIENENIIARTVQRGKMTSLKIYKDRFDCVKGTISLNKQLKDTQKRIIVLDDVKVGGFTILECAKILKEAGATNFLAICLGINNTGRW
ncbi:hypothetical protein HYU17_03460 [Candidatus Woesearchaeota archaeon]|nr:hypothetical protein [Candidatus Woesearchaeota archaeon]